MFVIVIRDYNDRTKLIQMSCKMFACCSLFQMGGSKKWECISYGKMELCRGRAASSSPRSLHVCAWLPPGRCRGYCRHILTGRGEKPRPPTARSENSPLSHKSANLSDSTAHLRQRQCYEVSLSKDPGRMPGYRESETPGGLSLR